MTGNSRPTRLVWSLSVLMLLTTALVRAQSPNAPLKVGDRVQHQFAVPPEDGEFRKNASLPGIACIFITSQPLATPPDGYAHCLKIGSLKLGMEFRQLQTTLGSDKRIPRSYITDPRTVNVSSEGRRTVLIPINALDIGGGQLRLVSYLVALVEASGQVGSLQLTGKQSEITDSLPFSGIKLGSRQQHVIDTLGLPSSVADVPQIKGKRWEYTPFPFSIEFVGGLVYSMRIHQPTREDLQRVFRPLTAVPD